MVLHDHKYGTCRAKEMSLLTKKLSEKDGLEGRSPSKFVCSGRSRPPMWPRPTRKAVRAGHCPSHSRLLRQFLRHGLSHFNNLWGCGPAPSESPKLKIIYLFNRPSSTILRRWIGDQLLDSITK